VDAPSSSPVDHFVTGALLPPIADIVGNGATVSPAVAVAAFQAYNACPFFTRPFPLSSFFSSYPLPSTLSPTHPRVRSKSFWVPLLWTKDTHSLLFLHSLSCV
jgi:hypothetical protein